MTPQLQYIFRCRLPDAEDGVLSDIELNGGRIATISPHPKDALEKHTISNGRSNPCLDADGCLIAPSLCHPHVHLDKAFILGHPRYRHLQVKDGTFAEAMDLTGKAKKMFERDDLLVRGRRLIQESLVAGVTHMRAFVEVDEIVGLKCLEAGAQLKREFARVLHIQLCAFAQLPLKPLEQAGTGIRELMEEATRPQYLVDAVGSTPYVEADEQSQHANVEWLVDLATDHDKHVDFHLDYSVDQKSSVLIHHVVQTLKDKNWTSRSTKVITLGHCTRLMFLTDDELRKLKATFEDLPISIIGLPTSDLYMMKTASNDQTELRTTLNIPKFITDFGISAAIGMNNIGNAFTPSGCCDPLFLANVGVSIYQRGTVDDAKLLYECISTRARAAIGLGKVRQSGAHDNDLQHGDDANFVVYPAAPEGFESEQCIQDHVYYYRSRGRQTVYQGRLITQEGPP